MIGVEQIAWENPRGDQRVTIEGRAHVRGALLRPRAQRDLGAALGIVGCNANNQAGVPAGHRPRHQQRRRSSTRRTPGSPTSRATRRSAATSASTSRWESTSASAACSASGATCPTSSPSTAPATTRNGDGRVDPTNPTEANPAYRQAIDLPAALPRRGDEDLDPVRAGFDHVLGRRPARRTPCAQNRNASSAARSIDSTI